MRAGVREADQAQVSERTARLHAEAIVIDGLNIDAIDRERFETKRAGGLTVAQYTLSAWANFRDTVTLISGWYGRFLEHADVIRPVTSIGDIYQAKAERRIGIILGLQNASAFEDDLGLIEVLYRLGIRVVQITYSVKNLIGDGCWERHDGGLSYFGISVIEEMNRVGMVVDLSHVGSRTTMEAIEVSSRPCSFNHIGCKAISDSPRNKTDEELRAIAAKGGVVGICVVPRFIVDTPGRPATLQDILKHIDHAVQLIGVDHVGLGTDRGEGKLSRDLGPAFRRTTPARLVAQTEPSGYYGKGTIPFERVTKDEVLSVYAPELYSMAQLPNLTEALVQRGYSDGDVKKLLGENWLRFYGEVWKP
jgi:membrane dipeptidase